MSIPLRDHPALIFTAVLFSSKSNISQVISELEKVISPTLVRSREIDFVWSDYYEKEMGKGLKRIFLVHEGSVQRDKIVAVKKLTDDIEKRYMDAGKRTVNIDPGLICAENLILATNKPFFHRVYLSNGVYAELTLFYRNNRYNPIEKWTYPEYRATPVLDFFNHVREDFFSGKSPSK